jgi:glycine/D-amino acid oxidase-like deaminating enzyme
MSRTADVVICGAGITGVAAAHFLSMSGMKNILLVDERPPLSLTSDRSSECYRNWWPDPEMLALVNRSIDLMESLARESGNIFRMNRRGYLYVTGDESKVPALQAASARTSSLGAGSLRVHSPESSSYEPANPEGFEDSLDGADLLIGADLVHKHFPCLTEKAVAALHVRRAGWLSAQQLGMHLLDTTRARGVRFESARVTGVDVRNGHISGVTLNSGEYVDSPLLINAAGPYLKEIGKMLGVDLPVHTELHLKAAIKDSLGVVGRAAPLLIWTDEQELP